MARLQGGDNARTVISSELDADEQAGDGDRICLQVGKKHQLYFLVSS